MKKRICKVWTVEQETLLREHYSKPDGILFLMTKLKRPRTSIWMKALRLGVPHYMYVLRGAKGARGNKGEGANWSVEILKQKTKENDNGCWVWTGALMPAGYGSIMINRVTKLAHRIMFGLANPDIDISEKFICHHCDNPPCINPSHLYAGTQVDNAQDMIRRKRGRWDKYPNGLIPR